MTTTTVPPAPSTPSSSVAPLPQSPATTKRKRGDADKASTATASTSAPTFAVPQAPVAAASSSSSATAGKKRQTKHVYTDEERAQHVAKKERLKQEKKEARMVRNRQAAQSSRDRKKREVDTMRRQIAVLERTLRENGLPIAAAADVYEGGDGDADDDGVPIDLDDPADESDSGAPAAQRVKNDDGGVFVRPRSDSIGSSSTMDNSRLQQALEEQQRENTELKSRLTQLETLLRTVGADSKSVIGKLRTGEGPAPALAALASPVLDGYQEPTVTLPAEASPQHKDTFEAFQDPAYIQVSGIRSTASDRGGSKSPPSGRTGNGHTAGIGAVMSDVVGDVNGSDGMGRQGEIDQGVRLVAREVTLPRNAPLIDSTSTTLPPRTSIPTSASISPVTVALMMPVISVPTLASSIYLKSKAMAMTKTTTRQSGRRTSSTCSQRKFQLRHTTVHSRNRRCQNRPRFRIIPSSRTPSVTSSTQPATDSSSVSASTQRPPLLRLISVRQVTPAQSESPETTSSNSNSNLSVSSITTTQEGSGKVRVTLRLRIKAPKRASNTGR